MDANQGIKPVDLFTGFKKLLVQASYLREEQVVPWFSDSRPALGMADYLIWFSTNPETLATSEGPGRFGNKFTLSVSVHLLSRNFQDSSQEDIVRVLEHEIYRWRLLNSIQNENLFSLYHPTVASFGGWAMPEPMDTGTQLSVGTMLISNIKINRTQGEEGTLESSFDVAIPAVLALTLPVSPVS